MSRTQVTPLRAVLLVAFAVTIGLSTEARATGNATSGSGHSVDSETTGEQHGETLHDHEGGHHFHKHDVALFLGVTDEEGHTSEFTMGLEYEYRINRHWGVGGLVDYVGELRNLVTAVPVFWHPGGEWKLIVAPGIERHRGGRNEASDLDEHPHPDVDSTHFLLRLGVGYDIAIGDRFGITPAIDLDLVGGEQVWVFGLNFAVKF